MQTPRRIEFTQERMKIKSVDSDLAESELQQVLDEEMLRAFCESAREHVRKLPGGPYFIISQHSHVSESRITVTIDFQPTDFQKMESVTP